ncbi:DinB family protein [Pontibacter harenae]|uniref:DinB family protein n=1 Tax=Pontibacter harenae TaxID=2894083 RepID=UPI001E61567B|nr:DinB family protein [Pontibacter harenae]MCC9168834.1 DinB family protein [Pontibacter harenae]
MFTTIVKSALPNKKTYSQMIPRPDSADFPSYYQPYIDQLPDEDVLNLLERQIEDIKDLFSNIPDARAKEACAEGKWTMKELLQHMLDSERIFSYRALCFSRGEQASLPGYDENMYAANSNANARSVQSILEEYELVRKSNLLLFRSFTPEMLESYGVANGNKMSLCALIYVLAAHELHHINILKERYLS